VELATQLGGPGTYRGRMERRRCPHCETVELAVIVYGIPIAGAYDEAVGRGEVVLGGRLMSDASPSLACPRCGSTFDSWGRRASDSLRADRS
jgi:hypothetical protein